MTDDAKYPPRIERLFEPRLPTRQFGHSYAGYPPHARRTHSILPLSHWRKHWTEYPQSASLLPPPSNATQNQIRHAQLKVLAQERKNAKRVSFHSQLGQWNLANIDDMPHYASSDPYCTVFILRLPYQMTDSELEAALVKSLEVTPDAIHSTRIVRDTRGKSRGYAFLVFRQSSDAAECVRVLGRTGLLFIEPAKFPACVDIERARIVRNWLPRRLGGGLGGRGFSYRRLFASAAALGRRSAPPGDAIRNRYSSRTNAPGGNWRMGDTSTRYPRRQEYDRGDLWKSSDRTSHDLADKKSTTTDELKPSSGRHDRYARYAGALALQRSIRSIRER